MKIEESFAPITFTIESEDELNVLMTLLHFAEFVDDEFAKIHEQILERVNCDISSYYYFGLKLTNLRDINLVKTKT